MIRALIYALISIFVITFVRMVAGIVMRGMSDLLREETQASKGPSPQGPRSNPMPRTGEFKPCQHCGTYVLASAAIRLPSANKDLYFCSPVCREKHLAA